MEGVFSCILLNSRATAILPRTDTGDAVVVHKLPAKSSELKIESYIEVALMILDSHIYPAIHTIEELFLVPPRRPSTQIEGYPYRKHVSLFR